MEKPLPAETLYHPKSVHHGENMTLPGLHEIQARFSSHIDTELRACLDHAEGPQGLWGMMGYHLGYRDSALSPVRTRAGKRFRPALCLFACESVGGEWRDALRAAAAIELLHNFSLVHDDIEDGDPMRHHQPTVWRLWGEPQAINVGDGMFALANRMMLGAASDPARSLELNLSFQQTALALTEGQHLDMSYETRTDVSASEYMDMIERKTAALIGFSLWCGATVGGASPQQSDKLLQFGRHMGLAYQIHDDYMGIWGAPEDTGKEGAQDLCKRKKTLPILLATDRAQGMQRTVLTRYFDGSDDDVALPLAVLAETGVAVDVREAVHASLRDALEALAQANLGPLPRELFARVAHELTGQRLESNAGIVTNV